MKQRIILLVAAIFLVFGLASCKKEPEHEIKLEAVETQLKWEQIIFEFKITGETEDIKIADGSLQAELYLDGERVVTRSPSLNASSNYSVTFTTLKVNTEYELVVTASISQKKVELYRAKAKTLLEGGHESDPIIITSVDDFKNASNLDAYYKLANDIDFNGEEIPEPFKNGLRGQFDGAGFKLKNFTVPLNNYNGIFGYMNQGTGVVKNLVIENVTYDNYDNIENRKSVSLYVGLITKELNANAKVENITFNDIVINLYTETYGLRYFGLVTASNKGTVENITLNNVTFNVMFNNVYESQIGGVVGKNYSTGKIKKVNYASGNFNIITDEHQSNPQNVYQTYLGTIVGEGSGLISEVVSKVDINVSLKGLDGTKKLIEIEGERFTVHAPSLEEGSSSNQAILFLDKTDPVEIEFNHSSTEAIDVLLVNGVDKTAEVVNKKLTIDPTLEKVHVIVSYKTLNTGQKLTLAGDNFSVVSATLDGVEIYSGVGELPEDWSYGTVIKVKGVPRFGELVTLKLNGVNQVITNNEVEFVMVKNSRITVKYAQIKTIYIGGIGGAVGKVENALYTGDINFNIERDFGYREDYQIGGIAGAIYSHAKNVAVINVNVNLVNNSSIRGVAANRLVGVARGIATVEGVVVSSTIKLNNVSVDDGLVSVNTLPEDAFTSEFVKGLI